MEMEIVMNEIMMEMNIFLEMANDLMLALLQKLVKLFGVIQLC